MAFSEAIKVSVRKKALGRCCICQEPFVEIHHIIPQAENGPDTEDNAAPLCSNCHERYGDNPGMRNRYLTKICWSSDSARMMRSRWRPTEDAALPPQIPHNARHLYRVRGAAGQPLSVAPVSHVGPRRAAVIPAL
jgi:HNH endonuclease